MCLEVNLMVQKAQLVFADGSLMAGVAAGGAGGGGAAGAYMR